MGQSFGGGHGQDYTIHILIALNVIVFGMWQLSERDVAKRNWMVKNFTASARNVLEGRVHTLLTSGFSQASTGHLLGIAKLLQLRFIYTHTQTNESLST